VTGQLRGTRTEVNLPGTTYGQLGQKSILTGERHGKRHKAVHQGGGKKTTTQIRGTNIRRGKGGSTPAGER